MHCGNMFCCRSTIKSNVNGRQFSEVTASYDLDCRSTRVTNVLALRNNGMSNKLVDF